MRTLLVLAALIAAPFTFPSSAYAWHVNDACANGVWTVTNPDADWNTGHAIILGQTVPVGGSIVIPEGVDQVRVTWSESDEVMVLDRPDGCVPTPPPSTDPTTPSTEPTTPSTVPEPTTPPTEPTVPDTSPTYPVDPTTLPTWTIPRPDPNEWGKTPDVCYITNLDGTGSTRWTIQRCDNTHPVGWVDHRPVRSDMFCPVNPDGSRSYLDYRAGSGQPWGCVPVDPCDDGRTLWSLSPCNEVTPLPVEPRAASPAFVEPVTAAGTLPSTGASSWAMAAVAGILAVIGGAAIKLARRP